MASERVKRESTAGIYGGIPTPSETVYSRNSTTPKREETDLSTQDTDNLKAEANKSSEDEAYFQAEYQRRSASISIRSSRPLDSQRESHTTAMEPDTQGLELMGQKVTLLVNAINDLRDFGLQRDIDLPELVLVGDQSHGKSSLMSALTEVDLPTGQGICTKCPTNIVTSQGTLWKCDVSLERNYKYVDPGRRIVEPRNVTKASPFHPWAPLPLEEKQSRHFKSLTNKSELENVIKWAQIALLNPNEDHELFVPGTSKGSRARGDFEAARQSTAAKFSPNIITIKISGPGLPQLNFYDLPGIFRKASDLKDEYLVKVMENLSIEYIKHPNALIIWTLAMKTDPGNSHTGKLVQDHRANDRCVGVLTNPDHVHARHIEYEKVLDCAEHKVGYGYFVTRQPGEDSTLQKGPDYFADARREEMAFFETDRLWTGEWLRFRSRCGTKAIQDFMSQKLAEQVMKNLPQITEQLRLRTKDVDEELESIPELPGASAQQTILKLLTQCGAEVRDLVDGESPAQGHENFHNSWKSLYEQFSDLIFDIKPKITVRHPSDVTALASGQEIIDLLSDDESTVSSSVPSTPSRKRPNHFTDQSIGRPSPCRTLFAPSSQHAGSFAPSSQNSGSVKREGAFMGPPSRSRYKGGPFQDFANAGKSFASIGDIRTMRSNDIRSGIGGLTHHKTYNSLCVASVGPWSSIIEVFLAETMSLLREHLFVVLDRNLGQFRQTDLYRQAHAALAQFLQDAGNDQLRALKDLYEMEAYKSFTVSRLRRSNEANENRALLGVRKNRRTRVFVENQIKSGQEKLPRDMAPEEREKEILRRANKVQDEQLGDDPFKAELDVAAYVRGYYMTAANRFVDSVCLSIFAKLFRHIGKLGDDYYLEGQLGVLGPNGDQNCRALMEEDHASAERRRKLLTEKERLTGFANRLDALTRQLREAGSNSPETA